MKLVSIVIVLFLFSVMASAQASSRTLLNSMLKELNVLCRGGSGDDPFTNLACDTRTKVSYLLRTIGKGKSSANGAKALAIYKDLNEMCRGYSDYQTSCDLRNDASTLLRNLGYCFKGAWWKPCQ